MKGTVISLYSVSYIFFSFVEQTELSVTESLTTNPIHADLWQKVQSNEELKNFIAERSTCLQVKCI